MRIALLTDGIYPFVMGGMQKHSYYLAKYFAQNKVNVDLYHYIASDKENLPLPFTSDELKFIQFIKIVYPKPKKFPGHYLYERYEYSKAITQELIKRDPTDFIYAKGFSAWHLVKNRKKLKIKQPVGINFHGYEMFQRWPDFKTGMKLQILKQPVFANMKRADYLFSYGGKISEIIKNKGFENKIINIPTGIAKNWILKDNQTYNPQKIKFCFVGRAERRKGIEELNNILKSLEDKLDFEFHFIGPIPKHKKLNDPRMVYHGPIYEENQIKDILIQTNVLVCPSHSEGMPNVILEGMASGCAIIATDVGAISELVDKSNGFLIQGDISKGLKTAFNLFFGLNPNQLLSMRQSSISKVQNNFTWEKVIKQTISEIEKIAY
jgi:glycosyltransferase involved in cell wall biosynthesis